MSFSFLIDIQIFLIEHRDWLRAFHIISFIAWMAGLLYLPRLFVYHAQTQPRSEASETFKIMERRLYRGIMIPGMVLTFLFGVFLLFTSQYFAKGDYWMYLKIFLVLSLASAHGHMGKWRRRFELDQNTRGPGFYRVINEVPTVIMICIVFLVIFKPL